VGEVRTAKKKDRITSGEQRERNYSRGSRGVMVVVGEKEQYIGLSAGEGVTFKVSKPPKIQIGKCDRATS
jgi:hypothetical protein